MSVCCFGLLVPLGSTCQQVSAVSTATGEGWLGPLCLSCIAIYIGCGCIAGAEGSFMNDCMIWLICYYCAGCQEYKESKSRGSPQLFI